MIEKHDIKLHYIETQFNSADLLTKDFNKIYHELELWTKGPQCIRDSEFPIFKEIKVKEEIGNPSQNVYANTVLKETDVLARVKEVSSFNSLMKITHILRGS